jgi:hypothetical protein
MKMSTIFWTTGKQSFTVERLDSAECPMCHHVGAIVELPPPLKAKQLDNTTHVCMPVFGGCNHGFEGADVYDAEPIPPCAAAMGCLCAGHARGDPADAPCNTDERG